MNKKLIEALDYCKGAGLDQAVFAVPFELSPKDALELKAAPICQGMVLHHPPPELTGTSTSQWLGCFNQPGDWLLPTSKGTLIFVGSQLLLTRKMALRALRTRRLSIVCKINGKYQALQLHRFLLWHFGERIYRSVVDMPHDSVIRRALFGISSLRLVKVMWDRLFKRQGTATATHSGSSGLTGEDLYVALLRKAEAQPPEEKIVSVPGRVLLVNAGLAAGGAERQIVNTLIGLRNSQQCESVSLLAEYIEHAPHLDFFLHELEEQGIEVAQVQHTVTLADEGLSTLPPAIAELAADLPGSILEEILNLVEEFRVRRPSVVHAWQDSSSIKAGIAAVIAGVPRIVLASRNVTPKNFTYYQDYMYPAYRALAALDRVSLLNNSEAGAADYTLWLDLPSARFVVVRNGVDLGYMKRIGGQAIREYRHSLGIPENAQVVGSIFRFWAEKRPMLWLQTAALVAKRFPETHFLIVGEGPMRREMESFIDNSGLKGKVHLPGARPKVDLPLSAMNIFVLTSEYEGTPNVVLEAQWLGLPIVATDAGGTRESFASGITGFLATNPSPAEIAALVSKYLLDKEARELSGAEGAKFVARAFGMQRMVDETLEKYGLGTAN